MADAATPLRIIPAPFIADRQEAEYARKNWVITAAIGARPEDIETREFWVNLVHDLKRLDRVEIMPEDGEWFAEVIVRRVAGREIKVGVVNLKRFKDAEVPSEKVGEYTIKWRGPKAMFALMNPDDSVFKSGFETRGAAHEFLSEHVALAA